MPPQVSKAEFSQALIDLGHNPAAYEGKRLSLQGMSDLYKIESDRILDAIDQRHINAHYDYHADTIWVDALDAAHFYFCLQNEAHSYSGN
jgi:hypothetical protein